MEDQERHRASDDHVEGEGSDSGTKDYNERTKRFIESGQVEEAARNAEPRSEEERQELREAERIGKSRAKGEDPGLRKK